MSDPFAPLDGAKRGGWASVPEPAAVLPVPANAPAPPARHRDLGAPSATWTYRDAAGAVLGFVCRFDPPGGKEFRPLVLFRAEGGGLSWRWTSWPAPRPLYGLDRLAAAPGAPVMLCEGEKSADACGRLLPGYVAVASPNGSKSAGKADWSPLRGRVVTIWPDADDAGRAYAEAAAQQLVAAGAASVSVLTPPDTVAGGWDAANALAEGWTRDRAAGLVREAAQHHPTASRPSSGSGSERPPAPAGEAGHEGSSRRRPQREGLMALTTLCDLWHAPDGEAFVTFPVNGHRETWEIRSKAFKQWLACCAYEEQGIVPGAQAVEDTLRVLEARATNEGPEREPWLRVGSQDGRLYIDLGDKPWRAIEITRQGWSVIERHSLPFKRSKAMRELPVPEAGGMIEELRRFVNVATDEDFTLVVGWLVAALRNQGPYPILVVNGEQGSGKSTFSRLIRTLVDPNAAPIRSAPRDERDLVVACHNAHVQCLDNLSRIEPDLADSLCRLATGGGFSVRAHYTDKEENIFYGTRPIILNGIPSLTDRADLADRSVTVRLQSIPEDARQPEDEFWADWNRTAPAVLGALCDALSGALRRIGETRLEKAPRLADFAKWVTAAESGLGWEPGHFLAAYGDNRRLVVDAALEASPVGQAVKTMMDQPVYRRESWTGTATELLALLGDMVSEGVRQSRSWPRTPQGLSAAIDRSAPLLKAKGIRCDRKHSGNRTITLMAVVAPSPG